ncbi:uncharacterized protein VTP21DRAFT_11695 [Calcarisporiella thermophila]|uniref:uncharacterized protein n=1 Tax=Calcarisporiella thermophila TaxID=911321 RepID=UPI0037432EF5
MNARLRPQGNVPAPAPLPLPVRVRAGARSWPEALVPVDTCAGLRHKPCHGGGGDGFPAEHNRGNRLRRSGHRVSGDSLDARPWCCTATPNTHGVWFLSPPPLI